LRVQGEDDGALLGAVTLKTLGLMLNPLTREILPVRMAVTVSIPRDTPFVIVPIIPSKKLYSFPDVLIISDKQEMVQKALGHWDTQYASKKNKAARWF